MLAFSIVMKIARVVIHIFLVLTLVQTVAAASYRIRVVEVKPVESYPARVTIDGVTIAVNPYTTDAESATAFDIKNLNSRGFFPVHIIIKNETSVFLRVHTRNVLLFTPDGEQLYSTPAAVVVDNVARSGLTRREPTKSDEAEVLKAGSPLMDFSTKELVSASIDPGATVDGFLFFFSDNRKKNLLAGSSLYIPRVEEEGTRKPVGPFTLRLDQALIK